MLRKIFTKRNAKPQDTLAYTISEQARHRIIHTFSQLCALPEHPDMSRYARADWPGLLEDVANRCLREYGSLTLPKNYSAPSFAHAAVEHFMHCSADLVIDFLEMCFQSQFYRLGQEGVGAVNNILREEGIGFAFSDYVVRQIPIQVDAQGFGSYRNEFEFPEAIKKSNDVLHSEVVVPCLTLLSGPKWKVANHEMLEAHKAFREGRFEDANTACGRAFETVLKTILTEKKWAYDPQKDTLARLVEIARQNQLFHEFYAPVFTSVGTVRNKLGGHGKGPNPLYQNDEAYAAHLIHITSADIVLLARLAGM